MRTKELDYDDFEDRVAGGFVAAVSITIMLVLFGTAIWHTAYRAYYEREKKLYDALRSEIVANPEITKEAI